MMRSHFLALVTLSLLVHIINGKGTNVTIPNIVHLVTTDSRPWTSWMFLNLLSILNKINPTRLYIHYVTSPRGQFFDLLKDYPEYLHRMELVAIKEPIGIWDRFPGAHDYAHKSDCVRMNILSQVGGIYLDTDILILKSFDDLRSSKEGLVVGYQNERSKPKEICNGVILSSKDNMFLSTWYESYKTANFSECWDCHSVKIPSRILDRNSTLRSQWARILPIESLYDPSWNKGDLKQLYMERNVPPTEPWLAPPFPNKWGQHLWREHAKVYLHKEGNKFERICNSSSIYNSMLRFALNGTRFLRKLCPNVPNILNNPII